MSRYKAMAPPPPPAEKRTRLMTPAEAADPETVSLLMMFDDLVRNHKVLAEGDSEGNFLQFCSNQEHCRRRWEASEREVIRLQLELQSSEQEVRKLEMKLNQARELHATEEKGRRKAEAEREALGQKWELVRDLITGEHGQTLPDDTRLRLAKLEASVSNSRRGNMFSPGAGVGLSPVSEGESFASILDASDLSFEETRDSFGGDESRLRSGKNYKRKSSGGVAKLKKRSRSRGGAQNRKSLEALAARKSGAGLIEERMNNKRSLKYDERNIDDYVPSAPDQDDAVIAWKNARNAMTPSVSTVTVIERLASTATLTPKNPSTANLPKTPYSPVNPVMRSSSNAGMNRKHQFVQKKDFSAQRETCGPCGRRIRFGKVCYKCRECKAVCHPECRDSVPVPCVPVGSAQKTPSKSALNRGAQLADFTPLTAPMIPALIVHCVNEIEARGLGEVGVYRVPGAESEVKGLREKFLQARGCPNLSRYDVHALAGAVKDFLRNLRSPLVPTSMWNVFTMAATNPDLTDGVSQLFQAISELPQPNRDTLAFLMLHLQKVSESKETKMPVSNLAKVLGPTIVGYSSNDLPPEEMMREIGVQASTMEKLITIDSDYWRTYISGNASDSLYSDTRILSPESPERTIFKPLNNIGVTPMRMSMRNGKVYQSKPVPQATTGRIFSSPVLL